MQIFSILKNSISFGIILFLFTECDANFDQGYADMQQNELYAQLCSSCHGKQLQQFKMLKTFEKTSDYINNSIKNGNTAKGMPAFGEALNDNQIQELTSYIQNFDYEENNLVTVAPEEKSYEIEIVVDGLEIPWGMAFLPNGDILITEKQGTLYRFTTAGEKQEISGIPEVRSKGQGGLLDIQLHPQYEETGWVYISYSYIDEENKSNGNTAIIRGKLQGNQLTSIEEIYRGEPANSTNRHFGNRMVFDREGYLFFSNGDRGNRDVYPQELSNANGKIHRLHDDGSVPTDNPFVNEPNAIASIYSYGHRNPQGLVIHPETGEVWEHEHGPKGGDEINSIEKGKNYGWPVISYGVNYSGTSFTDITEKEGMEQPIHYYVPSIAPCGMAFLSSDVYPKWKNNLFIGSLSFRYLERIELNGKTVILQEKLLEELDSRVRNVVMAPDGYLYVALENPGRIIKLLPK